MALSKEEQEQFDALEAKRKAAPDRHESINVDFVYDPDNPESVKKGLARGHLTVEDAEGWGWTRKALGIKDDAGDGGKDGDGDDGDDDDGDEPPKRRAYFKDQ